jgi:hypothetical protein
MSNRTRAHVNNSQAQGPQDNFAAPSPANSSQWWMGFFFGMAVGAIGVILFSVIIDVVFGM